jgi:hypothetical protein
MSLKSAETVLKSAVQNTHATVRKQRNRRPVFKAWTVSQLLEQYRDPRAILLEIASMDTAKLAAEMHGTLADALAERRLCAQAVLPYVAQKLPVQVDMRHTRAIHLNIVDERQYKDLVDVATEQQDDADSFNMTLLASATDVRSETPVTPPVSARDGERE